jgi:hypothetical protein
MEEGRLAVAKSSEHTITAVWLQHLIMKRSSCPGSYKIWFLHPMWPQVGGVSSPSSRYRIVYPENHARLPSHMSTAAMLLSSPRWVGGGPGFTKSDIEEHMNAAEAILGRAAGRDTAQQHVRLIQFSCSMCHVSSTVSQRQCPGTGHVNIWRTKPHCKPCTQASCCSTVPCA